MILRSLSNAVTAVCRRQPVSVPSTCLIACMIAVLALGAGARGQSLAPAVAPAEVPAAGRHTAAI